MTAASRRAFLAGAGGAVGAVAAVALPAAAPAQGAGGRPLRLLATYVAGIGRNAPASLARALALGEAVALRREPDNPYDPRAVSVWTRGGEKLGYVPRIENQALASLMDAGLEPQARIVSVRPVGARPEVGLEIGLTLG